MDHDISMRILIAVKNEEGVWAFAAGCMRNYLILKEKARQFDEDKEIQGAAGGDT